MTTSPTPSLLDIHLPDMQGWRVMERLKNDMATRHIPVCVISTDESRDAGAGLRRAGIRRQADPETRRARHIARYAHAISPTVTKKHVWSSSRTPSAHAASSKPLPPRISKLSRPKTSAAARKIEKTRDSIASSLNPDMPDMIWRHRHSAENTERHALQHAGDPLWRRRNRRGALWKHLKRKLHHVRKALSPERLLDMVASSLHRDIAKLPEAAAEKTARPLPVGQVAGRQESADRRRRCAQYFRAHQRAGRTPYEYLFRR